MFLKKLLFNFFVFALLRFDFALSMMSPYLVAQESDNIVELLQRYQDSQLHNQSVVLDNGYKQTIYGCSSQGQPIYSELICTKDLGILHHIWTLDSFQNVIYKVIGTDLQGQRFESIGYTLAKPGSAISESSVYEFAQQASQSVVDYSCQVGATEYLDIPVFRTLHEHYPLSTISAEEAQVLADSGALQRIVRPLEQVNALQTMFNGKVRTVKDGILDQFAIKIGNQSYGNQNAQFGLTVGAGQSQDVALVKANQEAQAVYAYERTPEVQARLRKTQDLMVKIVDSADIYQQRIYILEITDHIEDLKSNYNFSPHCRFQRELLSSQLSIFLDKNGTVQVDADRTRKALYITYDYFKQAFGTSETQKIFSKLADNGHKGAQDFVQRNNSSWAPLTKTGDWTTRLFNRYFHRDRVLEVADSKFLQDQRQVMFLCQKGKFIEAENLVNTWTSVDRDKKSLLEGDLSHWKSLAHNQYGIPDQYSIDPLYHRVMRFSSQEELQDSTYIQKLNDTLAERHYKILSFLKHDLGQTNISRTTYQIACDVLDLKKSPNELIHYLSQLSSNDPNKVVQEAYHVFFNESGVLKFNDAQRRLLSNRVLPKQIGEISAVKERELLNRLLITPIIYPADSIELQAGIDAVIAACEHPELKKAYHEFVENIFQRNGIPDEKRETFFIPFVDFSRSAEDVKLQINIVQGMADTFHELRTATDDKKAGLQKTLKAFHNAFVAAQAGDERAGLLAVGAQSGLFDEVTGGFDAELMALNDASIIGKDVILNDGTIFGQSDVDESLYSLIQDSHLGQPVLIYSGRRLSPHEISAPPFAVLEEQLRKEGGIYADLADALSSFETYRQSTDENVVQRAIVAAYDKLGISHDFLPDGRMKDYKQLYDTSIEVKDVKDLTDLSKRYAEEFKAIAARRHGRIARILSHLATNIVHVDRYIADFVSGLGDASLLFYDTFLAQYAPRSYRDAAIERSLKRIEAFSNFLKSLEHMDPTEREKLLCKAVADLATGVGLSKVMAAAAAKGVSYLSEIPIERSPLAGLMGEAGAVEGELATTEGVTFKTPQQPQTPKNSPLEFAKHQQNAPKGGKPKVGKPVEPALPKKMIPGEGYNKNWRYENASYHTRKGNPIKSKAPIDGEDALRRSIQFDPNKPRRIAISNGEFVVLDQTLPGLYHGHVRTWEQLEHDMRKVLIKSGLVRKLGKIIK